MKIPFRILAAAAACAAAGCASPMVPGSPSAVEMAADQARREERMKIMQQVWSDQTAAPSGEAGDGSGAAGLLDYPAGSYSGINFGPRRAVDSSLAEPDR